MSFVTEATGGVKARRRHVKKAADVGETPQRRRADRTETDGAGRRDSSFYLSSPFFFLFFCSYICIHLHHSVVVGPVADTNTRTSPLTNLMGRTEGGKEKDVSTSSGETLGCIFPLHRIQLWPLRRLTHPAPAHTCAPTHTRTHTHAHLHFAT